VNGCATFRFSTESLPERDRFAIWRELYGHQVLRLEAEIGDDTAFHADVAAMLMPGLGVISGSISHCRLVRTRKLLTDGDDSLFLQIPSGRARLYQRGREAVLENSDAALIGSSEVGGVEYEGSDLLVLAMPRPALGPLLRDLDAVAARRVPRDTPALRLLIAYVAAAKAAPPMDAALQRAFADHVQDLVALAVGATRDATEVAKGRGLAAARLRAIKDDVIACLHEPDLSVGMMAKRHRVTPRYIQLLFDADGTTFSDFVRVRRLASVHRMLRNPRHRAMSISAIAYEVGFGDLSSFNHAFRRAYGATPSEVRATPV
jgi:AraC-like DNA-binding protein